MKGKHSRLKKNVEQHGILYHDLAMQPDPSMSAELAGADTIFFVGYGARIGVRFVDSDLGAQLAARPSPGTRLAAPGKVDRTLSVFHSSDRYWIYGDAEMKCQPERLVDLLDAFDTHLRATFAEFSRRKLFIHAGVVGWNGRAIVFPGKSLAGKTTLVAELVKAGATYFSDEYAVLDDQGRAHPFAKPLSLRPSRTERQRETPVEALGGVAARKAMPVGLVVLTRYSHGADWAPQTLSTAEGALAIMANTIAARRWPSLAVSVIGAVADRARFIRSDRGEARGLIGKIVAAMQGTEERADLAR